MRVRAWAVVGCALLGVGLANAGQGEGHLSDAQIRQILIAESRAAYGGSCPCPYDTDRAGRRCGKRSAYSRPGGAAPLCYDPDVTDTMVEAYRRREAASRQQANPE